MKKGRDWDEVYAYIDGAWDIVLKRLDYPFDGQAAIQSV